MNIKSCPKCGRQPKIENYPYIIKGKNKIRVRGCMCPNLCSVIPRNYNWCTFSLVYYGEGDDNKIFKQWNNAIESYEKEEKKLWYEKHYDNSWVTDSNVKVYGY